MGYFMESRKTNEINIKTPSGKVRSYKILQNFPFSSETKRMGIVLEDEEGIIHFFLKGADIAIAPKISREARVFVEEEAGSLSQEGLRTLVLAYK